MKGTGLAIAPIFCDGVILQRDNKIHIYGTETEADRVSLRFLNREYYSKVNENFEFSIELPPVAAGGPYIMIVKGSSEIVISDILFGDVYILSGQSNMELPIRRVLEVSEVEIMNTYEPEIRQYLIPATYNFKEPEKYMVKSLWKKAVGEDIMDFSAAGLFFAKEIKKTYNIPVGLVMTAVGGSIIEAWMKPSTLSKFGDYESIIKDFKDREYFSKYLQEEQRAANEWTSRLEAEEKKFVDTVQYKEWNTCTIPSLVSDYGTAIFNGSVYLCKEVILEEVTEEENAFIYMGSIIDSDKVWINGKLVGRTEYRYPPRKYKIRKGILKNGSNLIVVRIVINHENGGTIKEKPYCLHYNGKDINLKGEWYYQIGKQSETRMPEVLFPPRLPICFYHTVIVPLSKIAIKGVLWYQGESNTEAPQRYADKFAAMISDWRELFGWEVPFIYVQLSNYREPLNVSEDTGWAELRDQQRQCITLHSVAMVVTMDIGEANDIHPQNKKAVGVRLAKAAANLIYQEEHIHSGPLTESIIEEGSGIIINFQYLENSEEEYRLNNFEIAGTDGIFRQASAIRKGKTVYVMNDLVTSPAFVRYAWCDNPVNINFYNEEGLPASGFIEKVIKG